MTSRARRPAAQATPSIAAMSHPRPPARRPALARAALAAVAVLAAVSCSGDGDGEEQVVRDLEATTTSSTLAETTTTTTAAPVRSEPEPTTSTTAAPTTTQPFDGGTEPVVIPRPATTQDVVAHTGLRVEETGGEARLTFSFDGVLPRVDVRHVERPVRQAGSGEEVAVAGDAVLAIRFEPASSARFDGEEIQRTYAGPDRVAGAGTATEVVRTGDFEALYEWAAGLTSRVPFRVEVDEAAATVTVVVPAG